MFSLLPGSGLGFTGAKEIAFGLGAIVVDEIFLPPITPDPGIGGGWFAMPVTIHDNAYSKRTDDEEIIDFLTIIFQVIE